MTDTLERMEQLLNEAQTQADRIKMLAGDENLTPQMVMEELNDTVMSLLGDVAATFFNGLVELHQYLHDEVEPVLMSAGGDVDPDDPSQLVPEDADELLVLLNSYKASLVVGLEAQQQSDLSEKERAAFEAQVRPEIDRVTAAIERVEEIRIDFVDDGDDEDDDPEDGDDEGTAEAPAAAEESAVE